MTSKKAIVLGVICLLLLAVDVFSKAWTQAHIAPMAWSSISYPYGGIGVFQDWHGIDFSINYVMNKGAAWGVFASLQQYLLYLRILIIAAMGAYLLLSKASSFKKSALSFVLAGAVGNVIDYFVYGHVVDMVHFQFWGYSYPVFNLADSLIFMGICFLFLQAFFEKLKSIKKKNSQTIV